MFIVTGGAGFIGSNIIKSLNQMGYTDIFVVDDLSDGRKFSNLVDCQIIDYLDKDDFLTMICTDPKFLKSVKAVFHQGAITNTTEWNGQLMMRENYEFSKILLDSALNQKIPFIYASSAAVYGLSENFAETSANEKPINIYGYSKLLFDQHVRRIMPQAKSQVVGLRYFNVYGPNEQHKDAMASVAFHLNNQLLKNEKLKLFEGLGKYKNGEQSRDFVYVDDVAAINLWFLQHPEKQGIYNVGTGTSRTFNDVANQVIKWHKRGAIEYIPFPEKLKNSYQNFTKADLSSLLAIGYNKPFITIEEGIKKYLDWLNK
jgi:ADP-L-glycero-D-manno-heptose 6-epimerase